ncbi:hypothetical protein LMG667_03400 [Xanthomonas euvesicatoria]|uniref:hypothetical protein n=1 Tax=Xanthomonas euvesicatoria TaxID=456327 RepID=UPI00080E1735|nr:hypothetical protein [Xanthomonas euvesicatoria]OCG90030.1 hypothetical protein LMG667_03400 [Xanthomonas euvesicatoria]
MPENPIAWSITEINAVLGSHLEAASKKAAELVEKFTDGDVELHAINDHRGPAFILCDHGTYGAWERLDTATDQAAHASLIQLASHRYGVDVTQLLLEAMSEADQAKHYRAGVQAALALIPLTASAFRIDAVAAVQLQRTIATQLATPSHNDVVSMTLAAGGKPPLARAAGAMHLQLLAQGMAGMGQEEVDFLMGEVDEAGGMLNDWEARLGIDVGTARKALATLGPEDHEWQQYQAITCVITALEREYGAQLVHLDDMKQKELGPLIASSADARVAFETAVAKGGEYHPSLTVQLGACAAAFKTHIVDRSPRDSLLQFDSQGSEENREAVSQLQSAVRAYADAELWEADITLFREELERFGGECEELALGARP